MIIITIIYQNQYNKLCVGGFLDEFEVGLTPSDSCINGMCYLILHYQNLTCGSRSAKVNFSGLSCNH